MRTAAVLAANPQQATRSWCRARPCRLLASRGGRELTDLSLDASLFRLRRKVLIVTDSIQSSRAAPYLSLFLKQHRAHYYELLDQVRRSGDWEAWLAFLLEGVRQTAEGAVATAQRLAEMFRVDRERIGPFGRRAGSALRLHEALKARPILSVAEACRRTGLSFPAASSAMDLLVTLGIARELTGKRRNRLFAYGSYMSALDERTEPL